MIDPYNTERNIQNSESFLLICALRKVPINKVEALTIRAVRRGLLIGSEDMQRLANKTQD